MVYGFFLIGSILVGAIYWIVSEIQTPVQDVKWAPGTGLLKPEPWLQTDHGGYFGWKPKYESQYYLWGPGAYLQYVSPTTATPKKTKGTTRPSRRPIKIPTRLPSSLPPPISIGSGSSSSSSSSSEISDSASGNDSETIVSSEVKSSDALAGPPYIVGKVEHEEISTTPGPPEDDYKEAEDVEDVEYRRLWTSKDQNEEAYEENPQHFENARSSKLPVEGWGYD